MLPSVAVNDSWRVLGHNGRTSDPQPEEIAATGKQFIRRRHPSFGAEFDETKGQKRWRFRLD